MVFNFDELEQAGQGTADFLKKVANGAANFACELYRDYPFAMTGGQPYGLAKGMWDSLCANRSPGLPVPPAPPPFKGGQCSFFYVVRIRREDLGNDSSVDEAPIVRGPISGFSYREKRPDENFGKYLTFCNCPGRDVRAYYDLQYGYLIGASNFSYLRVVSITPLSGQDNCGDLPSNYPNTPIPDARKLDDITVNNNDGTNFTFPIVYAPNTNLFPFNFNVNGNINISIDLGGITVSGDGVDVKDIQNDVEELLRRVPPRRKRPEDKDYSKDEYAEDNAEDKEGVKGLKYVLVELLSIPRNAKRQSGGEAQDVIYAGWFQFIADSYYFPREPVHFQRSLFVAPDGCTGYSYTLYQGFTAKVIEVKEAVDDE